MSNKLTKQEILSYLTENKTSFFYKYNLEKIGVFGSYARGEQTEDSDIDILIEIHSGTDDIFEKKQELRNVLENKFNKHIDICRERSIKPMFKSLILKDVIYV